MQQALGHAPLGHDEVLLTRERHRQSLAIALRNVQAAEQGCARVYHWNLLLLT